MTTTLTPDQLLAMIATLKAENAKLTEAAKSATAPRALTCKVSEKGALSIYGLGRFPITLYLGQFERLVAELDRIKAFVEANRKLFATKD